MCLVKHSAGEIIIQQGIKDKIALKLREIIKMIEIVKEPKSLEIQCIDILNSSMQLAKL